jgi:hypothetical protein
VPCPKCRADLADGAAECPRCGIIVAKYRERDEPVERPVQEGAIGEPPTWLPDAEAKTSTSKAAAVTRGIFLLLLALWTTTLVGGVSGERVGDSFLHLPNLIFHEAGHILFSPFGRFMTVLGGSLTQVLIPLVCAGAFLWQTRDPFGAAVAVWWAGENLIDLAPYIADARALELVLLGGKTGAEVEGHDWEYLLNAMGMLHRDHAIADAVQAIGAVTMIAALVWAGVVVWSQLGIARRGRQAGV